MHRLTGRLSKSSIHIATVLLVAMGVLGRSAPVHADEQQCQWVWNCTNGPCKHVPLCDHTYDVVPPEPMELPPVAPLDTGSLPAPPYPPAGREMCAPKRICDTAGNCTWQTRC